MSGRYEADRSWSDAYVDEINRVVRKVAGKIITIQQSDPPRDRRDGVDYEVSVSGGDIACRLRRADRFTFRDFTVTTTRPSGVTPEIEKIRSSHGPRWYLYAWAARGRFVEWILRRLQAGHVRVARSSHCRTPPEDLHRWQCVPLRSCYGSRRG